MESIILKSAPLPISPQKMNLVAGLVRKKELDHSLKILTFCPKKGGRMLHKLLSGMTKNLIQKKQSTSDFYISKIEVNQGSIQKKILYRAKGRADRVRKRYSLVNLYLNKKGEIKKTKTIIQNN